MLLLALRLTHVRFAFQDETDYSKTVPEILLERYRATADLVEEPAVESKTSSKAAPAPAAVPLAAPAVKKTKQQISSDSSDEDDDGKSDSEAMQVDTVAVDDGSFQTKIFESLFFP